MKKLCVASILLLLSAQAQASITVYSQPPSPGSTLFQSSGNGNDYDKFVYDNFKLAKDQDITEIRWRGGYDPQIAFAGYSGPVLDFSVGIWRALSVPPAFAQPDLGAGPVVLYDWDSGIGTAGETFVGDFGGGAFGPTKMYDYSYVLPTPFHAVAGQEYYVKIAAFQAGVPDWGFAAGANGDGQYFGSFINYAGGTTGHQFAGDAAFSLIAVPEPMSFSLLGLSALGLFARPRRV